MIIQDLFESPQLCPECGGISFSDMILAEKKDACYYKVKASAKVWPSAYASGRLVQCRKKGAANYGKSKNEGVAEGLNEFAPPGSNNGGDDGFSEETLKRLAAQWYNGDEDPRVERTLMAAGWEIGQDEGYDDEPGVFVVQSGDVNGSSYISWPAHELKKGVAEGKKSDRYHIVGKDGKPANLASYADRASAIKDRDEKYPGAVVQQVGPRGKVKGVAEAADFNPQRRLFLRTAAAVAAIAAAPKPALKAAAAMAKPNLAIANLITAAALSGQDRQFGYDMDAEEYEQELADLPDDLYQRLVTQGARGEMPWGAGYQIFKTPKGRLYLYTENAKDGDLGMITYGEGENFRSIVMQQSGDELEDGDAENTQDQKIYDTILKQNRGILERTDLGTVVDAVIDGPSMVELPKAANVASQAATMPTRAAAGGGALSSIKNFVQKTINPSSHKSSATPQAKTLTALPAPTEPEIVLTPDLRTKEKELVKKKGVAEGKVSGYKMIPNHDGTWYVVDENGNVVLRNASEGEAQHAVWSGNKKLKQGVAEGTDFDKCFDKACKLYDQAVNKNLKPKLVQVADFQGDGSGADTRWLKLPQHVWQHYVVIVNDRVLDPTAKQFGDNMPKQYPVSDLDNLWAKQYLIRPRQGMAEDAALAEEFDLIESTVERLAKHNNVDAELIWEDLESLSDDELYVFAVTMPLTEDWQKANKQDRTDGMSRRAVKAYRREHPGSKLKTAVTTKPSKLKRGSKASKRRKSYCSRSRGQMKMHSISCAKTPDKAICKARRRWNCE